MNVVGIVQTDLNEFHILFQENQQGQQNNLFQDQQNNGENQELDLFRFFAMDNSAAASQGQSTQGQGLNQGQGQKLQEMTVRIKGIPEGQKATFLQMYQVIQDAKQMKDLEDTLTIVERSGSQQGMQSSY